MQFGNIFQSKWLIISTTNIYNLHLFIFLTLIIVFTPGARVCWSGESLEGRGGLRSISQWTQNSLVLQISICHLDLHWSLESGKMEKSWRSINSQFHQPTCFSKWNFSSEAPNLSSIRHLSQQLAKEDKTKKTSAGKPFWSCEYISLPTYTFEY